jgi:hypothetical protein
MYYSVLSDRTGAAFRRGTLLEPMYSDEHHLDLA